MAKKKNGLKDLATIVETEASVNIDEILAPVDDALIAADTAKAMLDDAFMMTEQSKKMKADLDGLDVQIKDLEGKKSVLVADCNAVHERITKEIFHNPKFKDAEAKLNGTTQWQEVIERAKKARDEAVAKETEPTWEIVRGYRTELDELIEKRGKLYENYKATSQKAADLFDEQRAFCAENGLPVRADKSKKNGGDASS